MTGLSRALRVLVVLVLAVAGLGATAAPVVAQSPVASADFDGDGIANAADLDDDNDGLPDVADPFALDPANGLAQPLPISYEWQSPATDGVGGLFGLGFTGLMANGTADYLTQFDQLGVTTGSGVLTVNQVDPGDAFATPNTQRYAFQLGVPARPAGGPLTVRTRVVAPFRGVTPQDFQSMGLFVGTGDQDNYVKVTTAIIGEPSIQVVREEAAVPTSTRTALPMPGPDYVDLYLRVDPEAATVRASYVASVNGTRGARTDVGGPISVPQSWFTAPDRGLAVGIISTSNGPGEPFPATWDLIEVIPDILPARPAPPTPPTPPATPPPPPAPPAPPVAAPDVLAPRVTAVRLRPSRFATATRRSRRAGTDVRLTLSERASVELRVSRRSTGRRVGGRCVRPTRANRAARTCVREIRVSGVLRRTLAAGTQTLRFTGRLGGRRLRAGSYRLTIVATDAAGNRTTRRGPVFRVTA